MWDWGEEPLTETLECVRGENRRRADARHIFLFSVRVELVETISRAHAFRRALRPAQGERIGEGKENGNARARGVSLLLRGSPLCDSPNETNLIRSPRAPRLRELLLHTAHCSLQLTIGTINRIQIKLVVPRLVPAIEELQTFGRAAREFGIFGELA